MNATQHRRLIEGKCTKCDRPQDPDRTGKWLCAFCAQRQNASAWGRRKGKSRQGICVTCEKAPAKRERKQCQACIRLQTRRNYAKVGRRVGAGLCGRCGENPVLPAMVNNTPHHQYCEACYFGYKSYISLGSWKFGDRLRSLIDAQGWRCFYTGERIVLGENDSLDHVLPKSRFPECKRDPANLAWVTRTMNKVKLDHTPQEFASLLDRIRMHLGDLDVSDGAAI